MRVVALAGGTGSAKLLRGLRRLEAELTVVANVGDNVWMYGVYVCPDIDVACYSLAGIADRDKGWGIRGDTFSALSALRGMGEETWFRLGDRDLATCLRRTEMLRKGMTLTEATKYEAGSLGLDCAVLPVSDSSVETRVRTPAGDLHLQEFWVRERGAPRVLGLHYAGAEKAALTKESRSAISRADVVVVCPANPVSSIGPMLSIPGLVPLLSAVDSKVVALSPMSGRGPFSGPAGKFMRATGSPPDSVGVARLYSGFLDALLIAEGDASMAPRVESLGIRCRPTDTRLATPADELRLAEELLGA